MCLQSKSTTPPSHIHIQQPSSKMEDAVIRRLEKTYIDSDGQIILCNCIRMLPVYSDDDSSCNFTVSRGRILLFKEKGEWKMKHRLGHKYETMWYTNSEWSNVGDTMDMFNPDPLDVDIYYLLYKDELSATLTVDNRYADFHHYVTEILESGVKMLTMMNSDVLYSGSKRSKKSNDFHMNDLSKIDKGKINDIICNIKKDSDTNSIQSINKKIRKDDIFIDHNRDNVINNTIDNKKKLDQLICDASKSISKKWDWDGVMVGKKKISGEYVCMIGLRKDVHRMMVEIFLPHFKKKIRMVKEGKRDVDDMCTAPDMIDKKYIDDTSSFYVSRASMYVN